jgi:hypothetical protein
VDEESRRANRAESCGRRLEETSKIVTDEPYGRICADWRNRTEKNSVFDDGYLQPSMKTGSIEVAVLS